MKYIIGLVLLFSIIIWIMQTIYVYYAYRCYRCRKCKKSFDLLDKIVYYSTLPFTMIVSLLPLFGFLLNAEAIEQLKEEHNWLAKRFESYLTIFIMLDLYSVIALLIILMF